MAKRLVRRIQTCDVEDTDDGPKRVAPTIELDHRPGPATRDVAALDRALTADLVLRGCRPESFDQMIESWFALTYVLNNLNRGLGLQDPYPFILSRPAIDKLRFVHEVVGAAVA